MGIALQSGFEEAELGDNVFSTKMNFLGDFSNIIKSIICVWREDGAGKSLIIGVDLPCFLKEIGGHFY